MRKTSAPFSTLPAAPPVVWRVDTGFFPPDECTAAAVIRYEQRTFGRAFGVSPDHLRALEAYSAAALLWVTFAEADALRYGAAADVMELRLDIPAYVLAKDDHGGFLLLFPDMLTATTGGAAMADRFAHDPTSRLLEDVRAWLAGQSPSEHGLFAVTGFKDGRYLMNEKTADLAEAVAWFHDAPKDAFDRVIIGQSPHLLASKTWANGVEQLTWQHPASRAAELEDEDNKRRASRGGGDTGNPAHATLGANIRPEVGSGPAGLETYTTQKSADHNAASPEEMAITDYFRARFAAAERGPELRERVADNAPPSEFVTLEAIAADPWNAVALPLPATANTELLQTARSAAESCAIEHYELMEKARAGEYTPPSYDAEPGNPDIHEYDEGRWFEADRRLALIDERLAQTNDASTKRQEAERVASTGESVSPDVEASVSDYFQTRLREGKAEREAEGGVELALTQGTDQTPGGGGRGVF